MGKLGRIVFLVGAAIAGPALAQPQPAIAVDGTYAGVSRVLVQDLTRGHICPPSGGLGPLTIANGAARAKWGDGTLEGPATPQGVLTMRATNGAHFHGQIQGGEIKGRVNSFFSGRVQSAVGCSYDLTWRKRP